MKPLLALILGALLASSAHAYDARELREDCLAAEAHYNGEKSTDPYASVKSARCLSYLAGVADGYAVSSYLAEKVGIQLNAFCLPLRDPQLSQRLVRALLAHLDRLPPHPDAGTATLAAGAFARAFPCSEALEGKK